MTQTKSKTRFTVLPLYITVAVLAFPHNVSATDALSQPPVPTYETITSIAETTSITVSDVQKSEWKGKFIIPVNSIIKYPVWDVKDLIKSAYLSKKKPKPQSRTYSYDPAKIYAWTKTIADKVNTQSQDPELTIKDGRATYFVSPVIGKKLDRYQSTLKILQSLEIGESNIELSIKTTRPAKELSQLNNLGIKELIGRGESKFSGSPANRRHNIKVGVSKIQGVIVKPGEEFSFNKYLGPVEAEQGFKPELVIKAEGTVPELGGGLCQVSSTTFRAAMHAGLPITQRRNHSYAVQYYAPQGTDATIYPGVIDLKFINDTGNSILIWPYFKNNDYLIFDFYGTYDGRKVKLDNPTVYDKKSDGAMKATWTRSVTKDGDTKNDKFSSVYLPPALFHKEEQFVPAATDNTSANNSNETKQDSPATNTIPEPSTTSNTAPANLPIISN